MDENLMGKMQTAVIEEAQKLNKETVKQMKAISNRLDDLGRENAELKKPTRLVQKILYQGFAGFYAAMWAGAAFQRKETFLSDHIRGQGITSRCIP